MVPGRSARGPPRYPGAVSLHLFDSATRTTTPLVPLRAGEVGVYVCGATVQSSPHVGHLRTAVAFDVLVRWLRRSGYRVTLIRNVTDIDDKILAKSAAAGEPWWAWAMTHEREFAQAHDALGVLRPTYEPRATGHVTEMVELMDRLVASGHAYATGVGDVWFDVRSFPGYGALTNQRPEDLPPADEDAQAGTPADGDPDDGTTGGGAPAGKRDPLDFALWKAPKPGDPATASWPTPYGRGRPGWHLECSAMAMKYLGETFDLHTGGVDNLFPHLENEIAQAEGATGKPFVNFWMHCAHLRVNGEKMSKSLGNFFTLRDLVQKGWSGREIRYVLINGHYRQPLNFTFDALDAARASLARIDECVDALTALAGPARAGALPPWADKARADFLAAVNDDLNLPEAFAALFALVRFSNGALLQDSFSPEAAAAVLTVFDALDTVFGLIRFGRAARAEGLPAEIEALVAARAAARAAKDWAGSDRFRDELAVKGWEVRDSKEGQKVKQL